MAKKVPTKFEKKNRREVIHHGISKTTFLILYKIYVFPKVVELQNLKIGMLVLNSRLNW